MSNEEFLQPTQLCNFDTHPEIRRKALKLTQGYSEQEEIFQRIFAFVKEFPYTLEDWDIPASTTLAKGCGMCSSKTNLLVAMLRSVKIPARYRVYQIMGDVPLWNWATKEHSRVRLVASDEAHDHVDCEVYLHRWRVCDPSRDTALENGMRAIGLPLRRNPSLDESGRMRYLILASLDQWAKERQARRKFRNNRETVFTMVNTRLEEVRTLGRQAAK